MAVAKKTETKKKSSIGITRDQFKAKADPIEVKIGEMGFVALPKEFKTGSLGWGINGTTAMRVDGQLVEVQIGMNLTIKGSKDLPGFEGGEEE